MTWFKNIIQVQAKAVVKDMEEAIQQEVQKVKPQLEVQLKEMVGNIKTAHEKSTKEAKENIENLESQIGKMKMRVESLEFSNAQKETKINELWLQLDASQIEYVVVTQ